MKREADGDMGSPQKRSRRGDEEVRLLIPSKVAGSIIGKGGQNITKLRSQYKASITVPDCPGPERMLTLSSDLDTICNIVSDVVPNLEENGSRLSNGNELDMRMMIHQSQAGCVIGKAGHKIKEIREKTGAKIKIFSNLAPQSTDRVIQIVGEPSKCVDTIREVLTLIKQSPIKGVVNPYDPHNYEDFYAEEYGGWGTQGAGNNNRRQNQDGPRQGAPPRNGMRDSPVNGGRFGGGRGGGNVGQRGGNNGGPFNMGGGNFGNRPPMGGNLMQNNRNNMSGFSGNNPRPINGGNPPFERNGWANSNNSNQFSSPPPNMMTNTISSPPPSNSLGLGNQNSPGNASSGGKTTTQVTIPKELAGAIIGKGGGRIRKIRLDSGANITIDEPLPGSNDRIITITGMPNQIQMAQYLLQQSVHQNSERNNY
ncbi:heterogeneous nuclear ribonucleoprotein K isoform X2 [Anoplophora glabripennis]|nr:heterogeneous nuclear ribonucleoprotein K isoform X2 [Anoplophora glabripennis]XP_018569021.1 heterogeneous nuclear ribonucleoprotein K isoform X2 [Anoplophora glabripennis]XP_018569023.1 heterogeneous nuclear ribonucleoprotein K isoform X2 [Anoplophora glabripennis]